jgi:hypothetical protein
MIVAGRIGPEGAFEAAHSIADFVRFEIESLVTRRSEPEVCRDFENCALNALVEQRSLCALSLMGVCGKLRVNGRLGGISRDDQIREDMRLAWKAVKREIEDHRMLFRLLTGSSEASGVSLDWCRMTFTQLPEEISKFEPSKELRPLEYRTAIVQKVSQFCVLMMQDYDLLEESFVRNGFKNLQEPDTRNLD